MARAGWGRAGAGQGERQTQRRVGLELTSVQLVTRLLLVQYGRKGTGCCSHIRGFKSIIGRE